MVAVKSLVNGTVAPGFEAVQKEFERNFTERGELGAACAVYYKGQKVVDLWGGIRDEATGQPWEEDTMVLVFSSTKGIASLAVAHAHSRGLLDYEEKVAAYWPEFAQNGKANVTVRQLLSHQAGVSAIDEPLTLEVIADPDRLALILAKQKPAWEPGTRQGYHAITLGWYESEMLRRVDPQRRTMGKYFAEEIAKPLGLEFYIGLPQHVDRSRIAVLKGSKRLELLLKMDKSLRPLVLRFLNPRSLSSRSFTNPTFLGETTGYNNENVHRVEVPAANGIGQVRDMAKAYSEFATGGKTLGIKAETLDALKAPATPPRDGTKDLVLGIDTIFSLGYSKPHSLFQFGLNDQAFGTPGAGGSFCFADPAAQIGFAYAMNKTGFHLWDDPREKSLRDAVYRVIK